MGILEKKNIKQLIDSFELYAKEEMIVSIRIITSLEFSNGLVFLIVQ